MRLAQFQNPVDITGAHDQIEDLNCGRRIKSRRGFIEKHDRWPANERARDFQPPAHSTRQLCGKSFRIPVKSDKAQYLHHSFISLSFRYAVFIQSVCDVLVNSETGEQRVFPKHNPHATAAQLEKLSLIQQANVMSFDQNLSAVRVLQGHGQLHQHRLARAGPASLAQCNYKRPAGLALGLDQNYDLMRRPPRDPRSPLLDVASMRFIFIAGCLGTDRRCLIGRASAIFSAG
jgi:hypothetical protein